MTHKICSRCKLQQPFDLFRQEKRVVNGLTSWCKPCEKQYRELNKEKQQQYHKEYYIRNKEHIVKLGKEYRDKNADKIKEHKRLYYLANLTKINLYLKRKAAHISARNKLYREKNREKLKEYMRGYNKKYRQNNSEVLRLNSRNWYQSRREECKLKMSIYKKRNRPKFNAHNAIRRSNLRSRTPNWLTGEQRNEMEKFYIQAKELELKTGTRYHVDHIVPLLGEKVCGLHVPWNLQVLTAYANLSKKNKLLLNYD